ncbi:hypothetical protein K4E_16870 [Enterococcus thailandicus]|nr:hypothetical protein K4E_16870 [Enterococcus thailandicus]
MGVKESDHKKRKKQRKKELFMFCRRLEFVRRSCLGNTVDKGCGAKRSVQQASEQSLKIAFDILNYHNQNKQFFNT